MSNLIDIKKHLKAEQDHGQEDMLDLLVTLLSTKQKHMDVEGASYFMAWLYNWHYAQLPHIFLVVDFCGLDVRNAQLLHSKYF